MNALHAIGISAADFSVALNANQRSTESWLEEENPVIKKIEHRERLRELKEVTRFIVDDGTIALQEADWLRDPNRSAEFATPLELIGEGKWRAAGRLYCDDIGIDAPSIFDGDSERRKTPRVKVTPP